MKEFLKGTSMTYKAVLIVFEKWIIEMGYYKNWLSTVFVEAKNILEVCVK